ncbi:MAG: hypothetical protein FJ095_09745 [Deltaproteobacteria bacterium]|nr:hypothetical protein [Deltaproteobacteria bacterium]
MLRSNRVVSSILLAGAGLLVGCSSAESPNPPPSVEPTLTFETEEYEVGTGDVFECFYTDTITEEELDVYEAIGKQGPGGHHVMVFYTSDIHDPEHHPCVDSEMVNWNMVAGAAGSGDDGLKLRDNLSNRVPKGVQLVLQAHYINTTAAPYKTRDAVTLKLRKPGETVDYVNYFAVFDGGFTIPPQTTHVSRTRCTIEEDLQLVLSLGHMHERGRRYRLEQLRADGTVERVLRDDTWSPEYTSHPPIDHYPIVAPLELAKGTVLRQTCEWDNDGAAALQFPTEMCVGFFYYFPGTGDKVCAALPEP